MPNNARKQKIIVICIFFEKTICSFVNHLYLSRLNTIITCKNEKILLLFAAIATVAFISCTPSTKGTSAENSDSTEVASAPITAESFAATLNNLLTEGDTAKIQQFLGDANKYCAELAKTDNVGAANLLDQIKKTLTENADKLKNAGLNVDAITNKVAELPADVKDAVNAATDSLKKAETDNAVKDAKNAVNKAANAAADKAKEVGEKAKEGAENLKKNAQEGFDKAKEKTANAITEGANKAADAIKGIGKK